MNSETKLRAVRIPGKFGGGFRFLQDDEEEFSILISESSRFDPKWRVRFGKITFEVVPESANSDSWKSELRSEVWVEFSEREWMDFIDGNTSDDAMRFALEQKFRKRQEADERRSGMNELTDTVWGMLERIDDLREQYPDGDVPTDELPKLSLGFMQDLCRRLILLESKDLSLRLGMVEVKVDVLESRLHKSSDPTCACAEKLDKGEMK